MPEFHSFDGVRLAYDVAGDGAPVLLLHGFAADARTNWTAPGVVGALVDAGRQVIAYDARGHGRSDKPHDPAAYADDAMVRDAQGLLDELGVERVDVVGYSMGAMTTTRLLLADRRVRSAVLGGIGAGLLRPRPPEVTDALADALLADDIGSVSDPTGRAFRRFAEGTGADRHALAAVQRSARWTGVPELARITVPVLVLAGSDDTLVGSPQELAEQIPGARLRLVGGDHLGAVLDPEFAPAIVEFLAEVDAS